MDQTDDVLRRLLAEVERIDRRLGSLEEWARRQTGGFGADPNLTLDNPRHPANQEVDRALRVLGRRTAETQPNINYFNERLRDYEIALQNVKQMGYYFGSQLYERNGPKQVAGPVAARLKSKPCTQADMESDWFGFWCNEIRSAPRYHRKLWEFAYIAQVLYSEGKLVPGSRGLGFGCGEEPLPSLFVKYGASVLATDLDQERAAQAGWVDTSQHAAAIEAVRRRNICDDEAALARITFRTADMNDIPSDLFGQFDFCWSACALEHLGTIKKGLDFIENSLQLLRPGGVAVHTTEWNLNDRETIDNWGTVLFQRAHFTQLAERLRDRGFIVAELDFDSGDGVLDGLIDIPPREAVLPSRSVLPPDAHLKLSTDGLVVTSWGMTVRRPG